MAIYRPKPSPPGRMPGRILCLSSASSKPARASALNIAAEPLKLIALCFNSLDRFARYFVLRAVLIRTRGGALRVQSPQGLDAADGALIAPTVSGSTAPALGGAIDEAPITAACVGGSAAANCSAPCPTIRQSNVIPPAHLAAKPKLARRLGASSSLSKEIPVPGPPGALLCEEGAAYLAQLYPRQRKRSVAAHLKYPRVRGPEAPAPG
jgi:hypothetical protein